MDKGSVRVEDEELSGSGYTRKTLWASWVACRGGLDNEKEELMGTLRCEACTTGMIY